MAGQHKTRRNPDTGRLEKILPGDPDATPPLPAAEPPPLPAIGDFIKEGTTQEAALEPEPVAPPEGAAEATVKGGVAGAQSGRIGGPAGMAAGAVIGAGAGFLLSQVQQSSVVGTLEGESGTAGGEEIQALKTLVELQQKLASTGMQVKESITTTAVGSKV